MKLFLLLALGFGLLEVISTYKTGSSRVRRKHNGWKDGINHIEEGYGKLFSSYGGPISQISIDIVPSFKVFVAKLEAFIESDSKFLASNSAAILEAISLIQTIGKSSSEILSVYVNEFPKVFSTYVKIVSELASNLGNEACALTTDAITQVESASVELIKQFQNWLTQKGTNKKGINFEPIAKGTQRLTNVAAKIISSSTDNDTNEAKVLLTLILQHLVLAVEAVNVVIASELRNIPDFQRNYLQTLHPFVLGMTETISLIDLNDLTASVGVIATNLVDLTKTLNKALNGLLNVVKGITTAALNLLRF